MSRDGEKNALFVASSLLPTGYTNYQWTIPESKIVLFNNRFPALLIQPTVNAIVVQDNEYHWKLKTRSNTRKVTLLVTLVNFSNEEGRGEGAGLQWTCS